MTIDIRLFKWYILAIMSLHSLETTTHIPLTSLDAVTPPSAPAVDDDTQVFDYRELQRSIGDSPTDVMEPVGTDGDTVDLPRFSGRVLDAGCHRRTEFVDPVRALVNQYTDINFEPLSITHPTELRIERMYEYMGCVRATDGMSLLTHLDPRDANSIVIYGRDSTFPS